MSESFVKSKILKILGKDYDDQSMRIQKVYEYVID